MRISYSHTDFYAYPISLRKVCWTKPNFLLRYTYSLCGRRCTGPNLGSRSHCRRVQPFYVLWPTAEPAREARRPRPSHQSTTQQCSQTEVGWPCSPSMSPTPVTKSLAKMAPLDSSKGYHQNSFQPFSRRAGTLRSSTSVCASRWCSFECATDGESSQSQPPPYGPISSSSRLMKTIS